LEPNTFTKRELRAVFFLQLIFYGIEEKSRVRGPINFDGTYIRCA